MSWGSRSIKACNMDARGGTCLRYSPEIRELKFFIWPWEIVESVFCTFCFIRVLHYTAWYCMVLHGHGTSWTWHIMDMVHHGHSTSWTWYIMDMVHHRHGTAWYCMLIYDNTWYCMVLHGTTWYYTVLHGTAWYCMVLYGTARYYIVLHFNTW